MWLPVGNIVGRLFLQKIKIKCHCAYESTLKNHNFSVFFTTFLGEMHFDRLH